jgi:ABC-type glycerol-3-phosphate transport system permease component
MACAVISVIPVIGVFLLGQKYFIKGITTGGMKD